ncbi:MAG: hypothetical protein ACRCVG_03115 [Methanobacteriaceae archaeon]
MGTNNIKYSKKEVLKLLSQLGIDTRFISYCYNIIFINNLRFSKFSKTKEKVFKKYFPEITVIRSKIFQKICVRSSKVLSNILTPKEKVLTLKCHDVNDFILSIILEPYTRKYGIEIINSNYTALNLMNSNLEITNNSNNSNTNYNSDTNNIVEFDSIAIHNTLNNESMDIITDIFNGNIFNSNNSILVNGKYIKTFKPLAMVPDKWINSFFNSSKLGKNDFNTLNNISSNISIISNDKDITNKYNNDYDNSQLEFEFMDFAESIVPNFKENIIKSSEYIIKNNII